MKLILSGATGFIGKNLVKRLTEQGHSTYAIVRPSTKSGQLSEGDAKPYVFDGDIENLAAFMQKEKFDGVIHLASLFLTQHKTQDVKGLIDSNILFATSLIEAAVDSKVPWFINTGTFWQHYSDAAYSPVNLYAATKQAFEDIAQYYIETSDINFVTIKLNDTFGPMDTRPKIINLLAKISNSNEALDMSPGEQIMDISYINNIIDGYLRMIELLSKDTDRNLKGKSFAISSGNRMTLKELVNMFEKVTGKKLNINWGKRPYRPREVMIPWEKGKAIPGWKPRVSLEEGIRKTLNEQG